MKFFLALIAVLALSACAGPGMSTYKHQEPGAVADVSNTVIVHAPFDVVWEELVGSLATSFFVINNLSKSSRLINLSFSTDTPEEFITCGTSHRTFKFNGKSHTYTYLTASDSDFKYAAKWGAYNNLPLVAKVHRDTSLEGRINVYLEPQSSNKTKVSVNAKYIFTVAVSGMATGYNAFGTIQTQHLLPEQSNTISFNTGRTGTMKSPTNGDTHSVVCYATGKLEQYILKRAKP